MKEFVIAELEKKLRARDGEVVGLRKRLVVGGDRCDELGERSRSRVDSRNSSPSRNNNNNNPTPNDDNHSHIS